MIVQHVNKVAPKVKLTKLNSTEKTSLTESSAIVCLRKESRCSGNIIEVILKLLICTQSIGAIDNMKELQKRRTIELVN